jgi:hypothetical protein
MGGKRTLATDCRERHFGAFASLDCVGFRIQFGGHLAEGSARVVVPRDGGEFTALFGTQTETLGLGTHAQRTQFEFRRLS